MKREMKKWFKKAMKATEDYEYNHFKNAFYRSAKDLGYSKIETIELWLDALEKEKIFKNKD